MVGRPFRAMLRVRLELIWNTISKGSGPIGVISGIVVITLGLACLVPPFYMFSVFGRQLPLGEDLPGASPSLTWLATLHAILVFGLGGFAGLRQRQGFDRELLRSLPLASFQLLLSELPFGLLNTIPMLSLACFSGLGYGLTQSHPGSMGIIIGVMVLGVFGVLLMQQFVAVLRRLVERPRYLGMTIALIIGLGLAAAGLTGGEGFDPKRMLEWLPTSMGYHGLRTWGHGETGTAMGFLAVAATFIGILFVLTAWLQLKELTQDLPPRTASRGKENLWSFKAPDKGVARLFVKQVLNARYGKVQLMLPFFFTGGFVLCAEKIQYVANGSVFHKLFDNAQTYPLYALLPPLLVFLGGGLWMNQFAWDGRGIKTLFLAPISSRDILGGKLLGLIWIVFPLSLLGSLPLAFLAAPFPPHELVSGAVSALFSLTVLGTVGHVFSARFPRPLAESRAGVASIPFTLQLMSTAVLLLLGAVCFGVYFGLNSLHIWAPPLGFAVLTIVALFIRRGLATMLVRELDSCRETLCETLS
ncbi:MAG: hypothetical protein P1V97_20580 [Planctomycetota bacterium]|nr:hypothetical protein [Planctomycetota bacterium]